MDLIEGLFTHMIGQLYPEKKVSVSPWPKIDYENAMEEYRTDSPDLRVDKSNPNELAFVWIINFPLFEKEKQNDHWAPSHHMFTAPVEEDIEKLKSDPAFVRSYQYDLVLNGFEVAGGSIRIHNPKLQEKIFELIGFSGKQKKEFQHMLTAFKYGAPPHGGIAVGLDRLLAILQNEPTIREVIAFPKTGEGRDIMMGAPSEVDKEQLDETGISIKKPKR